MENATQIGTTDAVTQGRARHIGSSTLTLLLTLTLNLTVTVTVAGTITITVTLIVALSTAAVISRTG